jgi:S-adenosylmethionine:tRNA ribosyltransferase-isomerase
MLAKDFSFQLPPELIAQIPRRRGFSRLLVVPQEKQQPLVHTMIRSLPGQLEPGDCLVVNNSKVIPARLRAIKQPTGARMEILLHRELSPGTWEALVRPYRRVKSGMVLRVGSGDIRVAGLCGEGRIVVDFGSRRIAQRIMRQHGEPPLPPYIRRSGRTDWQADRRRYQTLFAHPPGSVAAPTAGLHFSAGLLKQLQARGVNIVTITLHVGWGTFSPLPEGDLTGRSLHPERYFIPKETVAAIARCHAEQKRVIACGTTVTRALEAAALSPGNLHAGEGETGIFIQPGYRWKIIDGLLTNFHLPESSLFMLVCARGGKQRILQAYQEAISQKYHFYSYGDAMLLL